MRFMVTSSLATLASSVKTPSRPGTLKSVRVLRKVARVDPLLADGVQVGQRDHRQRAAETQAQQVDLLWPVMSRITSSAVIGPDSR